MNDSDRIVVHSAHPRPAQVRVFPLFADLDEHDLSQIAKGLIRKHVPQGEYLFRQGSDADSAFFVQSGVLNVVSALPGGGEVHVAERGPGSMLGETALVATSVRTASVKAKTDVTGFTMERQFFQGSIAQASSAAVRILNQLMRIVCERLQSQYAQIVAMDRGGDASVARRDAPGFRPDLDQAAKTRSFPYMEYLPLLEFFSSFLPEEIQAFESQVRCLELARGAILFEKDEDPDSCYFVVRGALELCINHEDGQVPLAILGPGTFLGTTEIIGGGVRVACGRVREDATIFEMSAGKLRELLSQQSWLALKFQLALCASLIVDLGKINKRLARMASQVSTKMG
jgi:CRP-like cAMP-binding protein